MLRGWNRAVVFFACVGLVELGMSSGIRLLCLFSFLGLFVADDSVVSDIAKVRLGAFAKGLLGVAGVIAVLGTTVLLFEPRLLDRHLLAVRVITSICMAVFWGVIVAGLLDVCQREKGSHSRESETPKQANNTGILHK